MEKKTKKIRCMSVKELQAKMEECQKRNQTGSAYYGHLSSRLNVLTK